jgi:cell division protein FtsQ
MTSASTKTSLKQEIAKFKHQEKIKFWQANWRAGLLSVLAGGLLWTIAVPEWKITDVSQIEIQGNQVLAKKTIYSLLNLNYPQSLWNLQTGRLSDELAFQPPIAAAIVNRQLFPPSLRVIVKERIPVAIFLDANLQEKGFVDAVGNAIPRSFYQVLQPGFKLPTLKAIGLAPQHQKHWSELYQLINQSGVKIVEVDWRDPTNLILTTDLGKAYLGSYVTDLPKKIGVLNKMKKLPNKIDLSKINFIDVTNPESPKLQIKQEEKDNKKPSTS